MQFFAAIYYRIAHMRAYFESVINQLI